MVEILGVSLNYKKVKDDIHIIISKLLGKYLQKIDIGDVAGYLEVDGCAAEIVDSHSVFKKYKAQKFLELVSQVTVVIGSDKVYAIALTTQK